MAALCCSLFRDVILHCLKCHPALLSVALELLAWTSARQAFPASDARDSHYSVVRWGVCTSRVAWACGVPPVGPLHVTWLEWPYMCMHISIPRCVHCCLSALSAVSPDFCGIEGAEACRMDVSPDALGQPGQHCRLWYSPSHSLCLPTPMPGLATACSAHCCWRGYRGKEVGISPTSHWESAPVP